MNMKIKSLLISGLAILALSACSDDNMDLGNPNDKVQGYLTLNISSPETRTSVGSEGTDNGTTQENQIDDVTVVLTDGSGVIQYVETPNITSGVTDKFKVDLGTYSVYALVNNPLTITPGENIQRVISGWNVNEAETGYSSGKFFMVNENNSSSTNGGYSITISSSNTENTPAVAHIKVDRVSVKITDETSYSAFSTASITGVPSIVSTFNVEGYVLLNMNKEFNLIQKWGTSNNGGATLASDVLVTPFYSTTLVADQFYKNISEYTNLEKDGSGNITGITDLTKDDTYTLGTKYTTENRPEITFYNTNVPTAGRGETSGVIYKVIAKDASDNANTFYMFNNTAYTTVAAIDALPEFADTDLSTLTIAELRAKGIKVYENGVMYYTYYIMDPNTAHQYNGYNYYGVFRNSVYKLNINSFSGLGDDVPGGGTVDPSEPGDPGNPSINTDEAYIQVSVTVNPWVLNTIHIDL